jgi:hypothetical protein
MGRLYILDCRPSPCGKRDDHSDCSGTDDREKAKPRVQPAHHEKDNSEHKRDAQTHRRKQHGIPQPALQGRGNFAGICHRGFPDSPNTRPCEDRTYKTDDEQGYEGDESPALIPANS